MVHLNERHIFSELLMYHDEISRLQVGFLLTQLRKTKRNLLASSFGKPV